MSLKFLVTGIIAGAVVISHSAHASSGSANPVQMQTVRTEPTGSVIGVSIQRLSSSTLAARTVAQTSTTPYPSPRHDVIAGLTVMAGLFAASRHLNASQDSE